MIKIRDMEVHVIRTTVNIAGSEVGKRSSANRFRGIIWSRMRSSPAPYVSRSDLGARRSLGGNHEVN